VTVALPHPADDASEVITGEVVHRGGALASVLEELPPAAVGALARVPGIALDPFERLVDAFLDEAPSNTARSYRTDLRQWVVWLSRDADPEYRIHPLLARRPHVARWRRHLEETPSERTGRPLSAASIARKLSALAELYRYAIDLGVLAESPVDNVKRPRVADESQTVGLTTDELQRIFDAAEAHSPRLTALVYVLFFTGSRIAEVLGADVRDYRTDHGHRVLRIRRKGGKVASVVLPPPAIRALDALIGERTSGPIFLNRDGTGVYPYRSVHSQLRRLARAAGVASADLTKPHTFRHAFATEALSRGVPLQDVQDALGHADPRTTRRYDRGRHNLDRSPAYKPPRYCGASEQTDRPRMSGVSGSSGRFSGSNYRSRPWRRRMSIW
jgi:integrase/recombinase XerD